MESGPELADLQARLRTFAQERDWQQFHTPKNLAMALAGEVGELVELFQWLTPEESQTLQADTAGRVRDELADVQIYLLRLADVLGVDLTAAVESKVALNESRYPPDKARGRATKYTDL